MIHFLLSTLWSRSRFALLVVSCLALHSLSGVSSANPSDDSGIEVTDPSGCLTGCAVVRSTLDPLTRTEIEALLLRFGSEDSGTRGGALETLLFHANQVATVLRPADLKALGPDRAERLRTELGRRRSLVSLRIVDADGRVRVEMSQEVPIGKKQHLHPEITHDVTSPEVSFTLQRVGVRHLWARL